MVMALTAALLSLIGIFVTGVYPGIIVLLLLTLIPIASKHFDKKISSKSAKFQVNYYAAVIVINLLLIAVVLWMRSGVVRYSQVGTFRASVQLSGSSLPVP